MPSAASQTISGSVNRKFTVGRGTRRDRYIKIAEQQAVAEAGAEGRSEQERLVLDRHERLGMVWQVVALGVKVALMLFSSPDWGRCIPRSLAGTVGA